jgi:CelD/BcsL family acetyltransferase involved in cellulose biosynthesis
MASSVNAPLSVSIVDDVGTFESLRAEWTSLVEQSVARSPFLSWEWLFAWWQAFGGSSALRLVVVREGGLLVAIAPLRLIAGSLGLGRLEFLGTGEVGSDYLDVIVRRGFEARAVRTIAETLLGLGTAIHLDHLPATAIGSVLAADLGNRGWSCRTRGAGACPVIRLEGHTFESYLAGRGAAHRANVRRRLRRLASRYELGFSQAIAPGERRAALDALARFHEERWRGRRPSTAFASSRARGFHDAVTSAAQDAGRLRLFVLTLDGIAASVMYAFAEGGRYYFYQHGFDVRFRAQSPGLVLMALTIKAAIDEGIREFDLLWGVEPYKWLWADAAHRLASVHAFPAGLAGYLQEWHFDAESMLRPAAQRLRARVAGVA